jgi:transcriptional regulator NrdR family protein
MAKLIVKRAGHIEEYDEKKLYASVFSACLAVREPVGTAEVLADRVVADVSVWLGKKHEVTSNDIRRKASEYLHAYNIEAAHLYHKQRTFH